MTLALRESVGQRGVAIDCFVLLTIIAEDQWRCGPHAFSPNLFFPVAFYLPTPLATFKSAPARVSSAYK
jgi:hypothetical protein